MSPKYTRKITAITKMREFSDLFQYASSSLIIRTFLQFTAFCYTSTQHGNFTVLPKQKGSWQCQWLNPSCVSNVTRGWITNVQIYTAKTTRNMPKPISCG